MSPKWQRPTGVEREFGRRPYISGKEKGYTDMMREPTDKAALDERPFHLSEFKKPYRADNYNHMEHAQSPSQAEMGEGTAAVAPDKNKVELALSWNGFLNLETMEPGATEYVAVRDNIGMCHWTFDVGDLSAGTLDFTPIKANYDKGKFEYDNNELVLQLVASAGAVGSVKVMVTDSRETHKKKLSRTIQMEEIPMELLARVTQRRLPVAPDVYVYYKISDLEKGDNKPYLYVYDEVDPDEPHGLLNTVWQGVTPGMGWDPGPPFDSTRTYYQMIALNRYNAYTYEFLGVIETDYAEAINNGHYVPTGAGWAWVNDTEETGRLIDGTGGYLAYLASFAISQGGTYNEDWLAGGVSTVRAWVDYGETIGPILLPNTYTITFAPEWECHVTTPHPLIYNQGTGIVHNGTLWQRAMVIDDNNYGATGPIYLNEVKTQARCAGKRDGAAFNVTLTSDIPYSVPDYESLTLIKGRPYDPYEP